MKEAPSAKSQRVFAPGIFEGQVAIVTGGGSGIGLVTACELARLGARVAICGRTEAKLAAASAEIAKVVSAQDVFYATCDIREEEQVREFVASVVRRFDGVDILINNAGGQFPAPSQMISTKGFTAVVRNNLIGTFTMTREVANQSMLAAKRGVVVNMIANIYRGFPGMVHTGAARAGVDNMTKTLAVEWAQFGIRVNAIAPGLIISSGTKQYPQELLDTAIKNTPMKRAGSVDEVAAAIVFLASPAAQFISGATLKIDGGQSLWGDTWLIPDD